MAISVKWPPLRTLPPVIPCTLSCREVHSIHRFSIGGSHNESIYNDSARHVCCPICNHFNETRRSGLSVRSSRQVEQVPLSIMPLGAEIPFQEHGNLPFGERCPWCGLHSMQGMQTTEQRLNKIILLCFQPVKRCAEQDAEAKKVGLWQDKNPQSPGECRACPACAINILTSIP